MPFPQRSLGLHRKEWWQLVEEWDPSPLFSTGEVTTQASPWECHNYNEGAEESDIWGEAERAETAQCGEEKAQEHLTCVYKYLIRVKEMETDYSQWCTVPGLETQTEQLWAQTETQGITFELSKILFLWEWMHRTDREFFNYMLKIHLDPDLSNQLKHPVLNRLRGKKFLYCKNAYSGLFGAVWSNSDYQSSTEIQYPFLLKRSLWYYRHSLAGSRNFFVTQSFLRVLSSDSLPVDFWISVEYF